MSIQNKTFAPGLPRTPEGWIEFPSDVKWRKELFTAESMAHPAKMNLWLQKAIIDYVSEPGDRILDPMSGTGSLMIATLPTDEARQVYLIEDAPIFHYLQTLNKALFLQRGVADENITLLLGPCQDYLPMAGFFDHIIFSPPYADMLKSQDDSDFTRSMFPNWNWDGGHHSHEDYIGTKKNLGRMQSFFYNQEMAKIYRALLESLRPGGTMTVVLRDQMKAGRRMELSNWVMRTCIKAGFELLFWEKRECSNTGFKQRLKARGHATVDDEDVIGFIMPQ